MSYKPFAPAGVQPLPLISSVDAVTQARNELNAWRNGTIKALRSSSTKRDTLLLGGHQFGQTYLYCGMSGGGKSYALNGLIDDFQNPTLNPVSTIGEIVQIHFSFEMSAATEIIRTVSRRVSLSYGDLISKGVALTPAHFKQIQNEWGSISARTVYYVETSGNLMQMNATIDKVHADHPHAQIIVSVDHTHLLEFGAEKNDLELLSNVARQSVKWRAAKLMVILIGQLNDKIEDQDRLMRSALHYPTKTDIHGSKQLYWACDWVCVYHRPEMLNIQIYGPTNIPTKDMIMAHWIKTRGSTPTNIRYRAELQHGKMTEWV